MKTPKTVKRPGRDADPKGGRRSGGTARRGPVRRPTAEVSNTTVRPAQEPKSAVRTRPESHPPTPAPASAPSSPVSPSPFPHRPPRPIGPEALKALREAIRSGRYPTDDAVRAGMERLIRRPR